MSKIKKEQISAKGFAIQVYTEDFRNDYISLTDIARYKNVHEPKDVVKNWLRVRDTIEFLGLWETIHNPNFKGVEFDSFRKEAGTNAFTLSPQRWIENTNAIGIIFPNSYDNLVPELAGDRLMASIPFAGRYRIIDFLLSMLMPGLRFE